MPETAKRRNPASNIVVGATPRVRQNPGRRNPLQNPPLFDKRTLIWTAILIAVFAAIVASVLRFYKLKPRLATIQGAVIRGDQDTFKQEPVAGVLITASRGAVSTSTRSDAAGYFRIEFPEIIWPGETVTLDFERSGFHPLQLEMHINFRSTTHPLIVAELRPIASAAALPSGGKQAVVSNIRVRYGVNTPAEESVGSAARTFQVVNQGNVPCGDQGPCSPDGEWRAATKTVTLDAGLGNEYRDVRASCIAGPCPFTSIKTKAEGRIVEATATAWSNTATFLLEAEVFHTSIDSSIRVSYPVIFDRNLSFTLPSTEEGVTIEADVNGTPIVFPVGPDVYLNWAICTVRTNPGSQNSSVYQCELRPGYRF